MNFPCEGMLKIGFRVEDGPLFLKLANDIANLHDCYCNAGVKEVKRAIMSPSAGKRIGSAQDAVGGFYRYEIVYSGVDGNPEIEFM